MGTIEMILLIVLTCLMIAGGLFYAVRRHHQGQSKTTLLLDLPYRKLTDDERYAIKRYLASLSQQQYQPLTHSPQDTAIPQAMAPHGDRVYMLTHAITRYSLSTDTPQKWRYYLDNIEVHLPPQWEQHIADENAVELIRTQTVPLVISLNGHSLTQYGQERSAFVPPAAGYEKNAAILAAESEQIELLSVRKESLEEYTLERPEGIREALLTGVGLLLFFLSLVSPVMLAPWLIVVGIVIIALSSWLLWRRPAEKERRDIHCLRGAPKRWGLFGESNQGQLNNISLGNLDLIYPTHWQNYITQDLGQTTEIDIYLNHQVVRQGRFLSLHDEVRHFPLQRWRKNAVLAISALFVLLLLVSWLPLNTPLKMSIAWLKGSSSQAVTQVAELEKTTLHVGDRLSIKGTGMCSIPATYQGEHGYPFMPFDCSALYWNTAPPLPLPQSDIIDKATALVDVIHQQLHPQNSAETKLNPQLATAIQKSGMILLYDFADIVKKTDDLCHQQKDCVRLKNALVNLGNVKNWSTLVRRANNGKLRGMNVLLRPVSADALENLVNTATSTFFYRETQRATNLLNSPPPGGFVIYSDEGHSLVNHPAPAVALFDHNAADQWPALQHLASMLLQTSFTASGIITSMSVDANGTRHIALHSEPNTFALWQYLGASVLLVILLLVVVSNIYLVVRRIYRNRLRLLAIQQYYDTCFNHPLDRINSLHSMF